MWATVSPPLCPPPLFGSWKPPAKLGRFDAFRAVNASMSDYPLASRIVVKNIPYTFGKSSLLKEFSSFGHIAEVKIVKDEATKMSKGYAFIQYTCQDDAVDALENMDRKEVDGRLIYVELAKLGKDAFRGSPRTCGPPKERIPTEEDEKI